MNINIREATHDDLDGLLMLYTQLHDNPLPVVDKKIQELWQNILNDINHHIIIGSLDDKIVSSCVVIIVQNLTHNQQPYALVENVITDTENRNKGYATMVLEFAREIARSENCYKIMLMTGSREESTLNFYKRAGYNCVDKTAFIQWI